MSGSFAFSDYCDDLGPAKVVHVYEPTCGLEAILVIDNVACGPSLGGVRMVPDVTTEEVFRLARSMTIKNAAAGLPFGGGKAGIIADPKKADKETLIRAFALAIRDLTEYIPGPDMGTDETCMAWIHDEMGRSVGLPRVLGGIPLDELGATGFGLSQCAEIAAPFCGLDLEGARMAIEGYGNVGRHVARFLEEQGVVLVAASDSQGAIHNPDGMPAAEVENAKRETGSVTAYASATKITSEELFAVPCDILIPAARPDAIHEGNVAGIQAKLVLPGANIPATPKAESTLHERGILMVPDVIANAGGVICAAAEYHNKSQSAAFEEITEKIRHNTQLILERSRDDTVQPRAAVMDLAGKRIRKAMALQRRS